MADPSTPRARRIDLGAVVVALVLPPAVTWVYFVLAATWPAPIRWNTYVFCKVLQFALPVVWVVAVQRRRPVWSRPRRAGLGEGFAFGLVVFAAMLSLYHFGLKPLGVLDVAAGPIREKVRGFGVDTAAKFAGLGVFYSLVHSALEEYYWRWFVFGQLRRFVSPTAAILVSSLGFTMHHIIVLGTYFGYASPWVVVFSSAVAIGGAVWAWIYYRSGSLYGPWLSHIVIDAGIFIIGYDLVRDMLA